MTDHTLTSIWMIAILAFMTFWGWRESQEHIACLQSGGDVALGWFQDGCTTRKATP